MTRILRLLLIAAIALPMWQPVAAQESLESNVTQSEENLTEKSDAMSDEIVSHSQNASSSKFKRANNPVRSSSPVIMKKGVAPKADDIPEGCARITLTAGDVFSDGTGYQMLLDADCNTYGRIFSTDGVITADGAIGSGNYGNVSADVYAEFEYKIPADADGALATSNMVLNNSVTIDIPAGTYDYVITNPDPSTTYNRMWVSATYGDIDGRGHSFEFKAGVTYNLTVQLYGNNDGVALEAVVPGATSSLASKMYTWKEYSTGISHSNTLDEIATDPDQIIGMLRKVYMDKSLPGNKYRGYDANGNAETSKGQVRYGAVGTLTREAYSWNNVQYVYDDTYGWNINGEYIEDGSFRYFDQTQYQPEEEGLTLLLLEIQDNFTIKDIEDENGDVILPAVVLTQTSGYAQLRESIAAAVKSARIVTESKRSGEGIEASTLFKVDCNQMNKFFFIAKGQLQWRLPNNQSNRVEPFLYGGTFYDAFFGTLKCPFLAHMFEQFSPSQGQTEGQETPPVADVYQNLVNMASFDVIHDCPAVPYVNHHFMMYGSTSISDDCQNVRDLMFVVPDYRMMYWSGRSPNSSQDYFYYHQDHSPSMGMFVIHQNPITGERIDGQDTYKLHLTWTSNLLKFMPGTEGKYTLYRVTIDENGNKTYTPVGVIEANEFEYYDDVPMQHNGQQVTYAVRGQDVDEFLTLQLSNEESFIIPGLDRAEQIRIELNSDYYFSRYDAATQTNNYSNSLIANNTVGTNVKAQYLEEGSQFKFWRATLKTVDDETVVDTDNAVNFVKATVGDYSPTTGGTLTYGGWTDQTDFSSKPYGHGYHVNPTTSTISVDEDGNVIFDGLKLYDNFSVSVANNEHPSQYVYYVTLHTSVPFDLGTNGVPDIATWQNGKTFVYFEAFTNWTNVSAWAWDSNNNDYNYTGGTWPGEEMDYVGMHGTNAVYRWAISPEDFTGSPNKILFTWSDNGNQQTNDFDFANGGYYTTSGLVSVINTSQEARSNTVSVPVYKTEMTMNPITAAQVEADAKHLIPAATKFDVNTRHSSLSEILAYYIYRWADTETSAANRSIYESNGDDSSPQGQADNHVDYYTVAMNTDYNSQTVNFVNNNGVYADVTASFEDNYMVNDADKADTYTYAPVVELFAPVQAVELPSGVDREDYNTYGGPQDMSAGGIVKAEVQYGGCSTFTWTADGKTYRYYNVFIPVNTLSLPGGGEYEVVKVRAWRKAKSEYLGEEAGKGYEYRLGYKVGTEYNEFMFDEADGCTTTTVLGADGNANTGIFKGTFGAVDVKGSSSITEVPLEIVVRVYFTKPSGSKSDAQKYYIAETTVPAKLTSDIPTAINGVEVMSNVVSKKYYNSAGVESDKPFQGVNIVVTRYSDGSTTTTKILK